MAPQGFLFNGAQLERIGAYIAFDKTGTSPLDNRKLC